MSLDQGWGVKSVKSLENWDSRFTVTSAIPMYNGLSKKGLPLSAKLMLAMADIFGFCFMVHLQISPRS